MAEGQGTTPTATQDKKGGAPVQDKTSDAGSWISKPEQLGNNAGDTIESTLSPVSNTVGKGLETVAKPVGGLVDGVLGGVMRSGEAFGETVGVGYGNKKKVEGDVTDEKEVKDEGVADVKEDNVKEGNVKEGNVKEGKNEENE